MPEPIRSFTGAHAYLSNFYPCHVHYAGITYQSSEAAFQASKTFDPDEREAISFLSAKEAKKMGRKIQLREDWHDARIFVMLEVVKRKFEQHPNLAALLVATGDAELIEGNTWNDTFWGVCNGKGENVLGHILMMVRANLRRK